MTNLSDNTFNNEQHESPVISALSRYFDIKKQEKASSNEERSNQEDSNQ